MISIENLSKNYFNQDIFDDVSFKINSKEKIGLVGKNGSGKTTFFNMVAMLEEPSSGKINIPKDYKISYVKQELNFEGNDIIEEVTLALKGKVERYEIEKILSGLGFEEKDFDKSPYSFSGGYQIRLNLAKVLLSDADLLLLDEPNNYLDLASIRWLEEFLISWKKEIFLITHDKYFMDKIVSHIAGIYRKKLIKIKGKTNDYFEKISKSEEIFEKTRVNEEKKIKDMQVFISKFRAKARQAGMVQSRIKTLEKIEPKNKLEKEDNIAFSFSYQDFSAKTILTADKISYSYNKEKEIFKDFSLEVQAKDRICIIGKNGKGKTTLLKTLAEVLEKDSGNISYSPQAVKGIFLQNYIENLFADNTILEELANVCGSSDMQKVRKIAATLLFRGDSVNKKISVLSGGEKQRVVLGKLLLSPSNILFLDEPTTHLDMESCQSLLVAIKEYPGTVILVSHNENFLEEIAEKLIVFDNNEINFYNLTYKDFLEKIGWNNENKTFKGKPKNLKKEIKREKAKLVFEKSKTLKPLKDKIIFLENKINDLEEEAKILNEQIINFDYSKNQEKIADLVKNYKEIQNKVNLSLEELENLLLLCEEEEQKFDLLINDVNKF